MIRPVELFVGLRYTRAKRRNHFISFISLISVAGIALAVWALITVMSVMNGFGKEIRSHILSVASHVTVGGSSGRLSDWRGLSARLAGRPEIIGQAPFVLGQGMLTYRGRASGVLVRGILPEQERSVSDIAQKMVAGRLDELKSRDYGIVIGTELAWTLRAGIGSKIVMVSPQARQVSPAGVLPRLRRFRVTGIFEVGNNEYDSGLALIHMDDAARLFRLRDDISGLRIKLQDLFAAPRFRDDLQRELGTTYRVRDWTQENVNFFRALKLEKRVMFIILFLILAVAAFNVVSTLVMVVEDKRSDIAILRTLGMRPRGVMLVFLIQGAVIGLVGTLIGGGTGILTALNVETIVPAIEQLFGTQFLSSDVYYISEVPSDMQWLDVLSVTGAALIITLLATLYPAWRAARTQPAESLRYE